MECSFQNVGGLRNKDKNFLNELNEWDVIVLTETWTKVKGWEKIKDWLPKEYVWKKQMAKKAKRGGQQKGW